MIKERLLLLLPLQLQQLAKLLLVVVCLLPINNSTRNQLRPDEIMSANHYERVCSSS